MYKEISKGQLGKGVNFGQMLNMSSTSAQIEVTIIGKTNSLINQSFIRKYGQNWYEVTEKPIDSIVFYGDGMKCFTYFSALEDYWQTFQFDLQKFIIIIKNNFTQYSPLEKQYISIHSPNILPEFYTSEFNCFELLTNGRYFVEYSQLNTELSLSF